VCRAHPKGVLPPKLVHQWKYREDEGEEEVEKRRKMERERRRKKRLAPLQSCSASATVCIYRMSAYMYICEHFYQYIFIFVTRSEERRNSLVDATMVIKGRQYIHTST
jgi:hypothetical protein